MPKPGKKLEIEILTSGIKDLDLLEKWGKYLAENDTGEYALKKISTSQIRKFFGALKKIQADFEILKHEIILLDPKLAYAVGRDRVKGGDGRPYQKTKIKEFYEQISPLIKAIGNDKAKFKNLVSILEAIVAYHKAEGGDITN